MITSETAQTSRAKRINRLAIAALACGIAQFSYVLYKGLAIIFIAAIIFGHIALRQIRRTGERGRGLALTGLILGYIVLGLGLLALLLFPLRGGPGNP